MSLRTRTLLMITFLLVGTVLVISALFAWNSRQAILAQQEQDGLLIARLLARTASIVDGFPQEMEDAIGEQMVVQATIAAHLVAIAEQAGLTPEEINAHLVEITETTALSEFWITDSTGAAYLHNLPGVDFTFSPDPQEQPQASIFWLLLTGERSVIIQDARQREIDVEIFKYVGVSGIDGPRIVQVGYNAAILEELRQRVGLQRLVEGLISAGDINAIRVVDNQTSTLVFSGLPEIDPEALSAVDRRQVEQVLYDGQETAYLDNDLLKVVVPVRAGSRGTIMVGAVMVYLPTDRLRTAMTDQLVSTAVVAAFVLIGGVLASSWLSRRVSDPVMKVTAAATAVENGKYKTSLLHAITGRSDELGRLGRVFDRMALEVSARDRRLKLLRRVIPVGVGLSTEQDFNRLLEAIVIESQALTNADGGTIYFLEKQQLKWMIVRNEKLGFAMGGTTGKPVQFAPLPLKDPETGEPNHGNVATHAALVNQPVNIQDAYQAKGFDFSGTRAFDARTGYRSKSFLTIPLEGEEKQVIGVLQLINARDPETDEVIAFASDEVFETLMLLASTALVAYLRLDKLRKEIEKLNIQIDEAKMTRQVSEITETEYFRTLKGKVQQMRSKQKKKE
ncbi:MAG: GAF domain-containing protein [Anaerolineales bacterium]|nr:GAF domain-containing protein [Anaerolineales bacterium]